MQENKSATSLPRDPNDEETTLSSKETDHLVCSTKKQKATLITFMPHRPILSYKDLVLRPSFDWEDHSAQTLPHDDEDAYSDIEQDSDDPYPTILVSSEEKLGTRSLWRSTLIIKAFGKSVDFFLIYFKLKEDFWKVINKGPWFIGQQFLSICR